MTLKVLNLKAENFKRLKAVDITPTGDLVFVGGKNAQGKTSVLDAIWAALAGGDASRLIKKPIRDGEDHASVTVDLGEYVVTRKWNKDDAGTLTVAAPSGAKFGSPQKLLDEIVGARAFDPLAFTRLSAKEQVAALLGLVHLDIDLEALASEKARLFEERTAVGRQGKALGEPAPLHEGVPDVEASASQILNQIRATQDRNRDIEAARGVCETLSEDAVTTAHEIQRLQEHLKDVKAKHTQAKERVAFLGDPQDTSELESSLSDVEETNRLVRENARIREISRQRDVLRDEYARLTDEIGALEYRKAEALQAANFPVDGLSFSDEGVTLNGIPFAQASSAEQLKVSTALAIAANPTLRVLRILDGSLLDSDSLRIIADLAGENDYQVWIEVVDESGELGIVIEDGEVRS